MGGKRGKVRGKTAQWGAWQRSALMKASALYPNTLIWINIFLYYLFLQTSVLHMCSLFHAFIFAQLWTVYCEQTAVAPTVQNQNEFSFTAILTALEFWSRVTPSILQLMAHNKVVSQVFCTGLGQIKLRRLGFVSVKYIRLWIMSWNNFDAFEKLKGKLISSGLNSWWAWNRI